MIVLRGDWRGWEPLPWPTALSIGVYDGVHLGHRKVLEILHDVAGDLHTAVLTFSGHPLAVSAPDHAPQLLATTEQKLEWLEEAGVDAVGLLDFDLRLRTMPPEDFVREIVVGKMRAEKVVVGEDFRFGYERAGDVDLLIKMGEDMGFEVVPVALVGDVVPYSSTAVRQVIDAGNVRAAAELLGRPFELRGDVVPGDGRGRTIGIPTANLQIANDILLPRRGVYAVEVEVDGEVHPGVVNIGIRPTFGGTRETVEVHLLDYQGDLYGKELRVRFIDRIRDERRFPNAEALVAQIHDDIDAARRMLTG